MRYARAVRSRRVVAVGLASLAVAIAGCADSGRRLGATPTEALASADALFGSLAGRFGPAESAPGYDDARTKLGRSALVPSRLFEDSALWTATRGDVRYLDLGGRPGSRTYLLGIRGVTDPPRRPGEYRRSVGLRDLTNGQYEWRIRDELAVGPVTGRDMGSALGTLLRAAEITDSTGVREAYRGALPRTTRALGQLFTLDSITVTPAPGGGTRLSLTATTHPDRIAEELPDLSRFLQRHASPAILDVVVEDRDGSRWWVASLERDRMRLDLRVHDGRLAPLEGPLRPMPDELVVRAAVSTRFGLFRVGLSELVGDVTLTRTPAEKAFTARFRREPRWSFPPLVERLIRSPLRRPFEGEGASLGFAVRTSSGTTTLVREYRLAVQESAIVRWLGALGSSTVSDFRRGAERQADVFNGRVFDALRADARRMIR